MQIIKSLLDLPTEIILKIRNELGMKTETELSLSCKTIHRMFITYAREFKCFTLLRDINYVTLGHLSSITFENRYYKPELIAHVLLHCLNLETIRYKSRERWSLKFIKYFFNSTVNRRMTFVVPDLAYAKFQTIRGKRHLNITLKKSSLA